MKFVSKKDPIGDRQGVQYEPMQFSEQCGTKDDVRFSKNRELRKPIEELKAEVYMTQE